MKHFYLLLGLITGIFLTSHAQIIEVVGKGAQDSTTVKLYFNNADNIDEIRTEAILWGDAVLKSSTDEVEFSDVDDSFSGLTTETENRQYNTAGGGYSGYFQADFTDIDPGSIDVQIPDAIKEITYSAYAYIYRDLIAPTYYSLANFDHAEFYQNGSGDPYEVSFTIDDTDYEKDLRVWIPFTELNIDNRYGVVTIIAGDVTVVDTIYDYNSQYPSFYLEPILVEGVDGDVTDVDISIYSPDPGTDGANGDSFITSGVVLDVMCDKYCTLTQYFYGSNCAKFCGCNRANDILTELLETDLVLGDT